MGKSIYDTLDPLFVYVSIMGDISAGSGYYTMMVAILWTKGWIMADRCHSLKSDISPWAFHCRLVVLQASSTPHDHNPQ